MKHSEEKIRDSACALTHAMQDLFAGEPTASVYMAIGYVLGQIEMSGKIAARDETFRILGLAMDDFIRLNRELENRQSTEGSSGSAQRE